MEGPKLLRRDRNTCVARALRPALILTNATSSMAATPYFTPSFVLNERELEIASKFPRHAPLDSARK